MLDWMKKLFKKEDTSVDASDVLETDPHSRIQEPEGSGEEELLFPHAKGKFRFPIVPDEQQILRSVHSPHTEKHEAKRVPDKTLQEHEPPVARPRRRMVQKESESINHAEGRSLQHRRMRRERQQSVYENDTVHSIEEQGISSYFQQKAVRSVKEPKQPEPKQPEPPIPTRSVLPKSNRRPFRPTETISPVFGYERPAYDLRKKQQPEELVLSSHGPSVVDVWLEKNGYVERVQSEDAVIEDRHVEMCDEPEHEESTLARVDAGEQEATVLTEMEDDASASTEAVHSVNPVVLEQELPAESIVEVEEPTIQSATSHDERAYEEHKQADQPKEEAISRQDESAEEVRSVYIPSEQEPVYIPTEQKKEHDRPPLQEDRPRQKRYVPYNVIMLKQDKQRLPKKSAEQVETKPVYSLPSLDLLRAPEISSSMDEEWLQEQTDLLNTTFVNFHIGAKVVHTVQGPSVTRFEVQPEPGVKVNKITNLSDDIKLSLSARDIRIEAPIPGKNAVGIEVPNQTSKPVFLREILQSRVFTSSESPLTVALGLDISGQPVVTDICKMPHGLIAGATGSGKSVCINAILTSILYKARPHEVKLLLIDPKMVELAPYNNVPHLVAPVITDVKAATAALKWAVEEMERRYESFAHAGARDITRYNELVKKHAAPGQPLPYIVIVIDELADLMMVSPADVEEAICRIAQKARACGIHLLVATQRPSVDVITGLIKANIPTRVAFTVSSQVDSRTIIDANGAERLLGRGDMLFLGNGTSKPVRIQGVYVSDDEIEQTVSHVKREMKPHFLFKQEDLLTKAEQSETEDELFYEACQFVLEQGGASASLLQRRFRIGYNRAARLVEDMEAQGIISGARGSKPRDILITETDLAALQDVNM